MASIRIYSVGSAVLLLLIFIPAQYILRDSPVITHNPAVSCMSASQGNKFICAVCINNFNILTLPGYNWKIESNQNFRIAKFKQNSYLNCSQFLQMIDGAKFQDADKIALQDIPSIQTIAQEAGFTSTVGWTNSTSIPINFAEIILVNINKQNQSKFEITTANPIINTALIVFVQIISFVGIGFAAIIVVLYHNEKGWIKPMLSFLPAATLMIVLTIFDSVTYQSHLLIIPLICYYMYMGHLLNIPDLSIFILCFLMLLSDAKFIDLLIQSAFLCVLIIYNSNNVTISKLYCLSCTLLLIFNSFFLRVKWTDSISVRCSIFESVLVVFIPLLMELQRLEINIDNNRKEVKMNAVELEQSSLHIQE